MSAGGYLPALTPAYKEFSSLYPNIALDVTEVRQPFTAELFQSVLDGSHDLAIVPTGELPAGEDNLETRLLFRDRFAVLTSLSHPLCGRGSVSASELSGETVLVLDYMKLMPIQLVENSLFINGIPGITIEMIDSPEAPQPPSYLLLKVQAGAGIAIVPRISALTAGWTGKMEDLSDLFLPFDISIIWRKNNINPSLQLFTGILEKYLPRL